MFEAVAVNLSADNFVVVCLAPIACLVLGIGAAVFLANSPLPSRRTWPVAFPVLTAALAIPALLVEAITSGVSLLVPFLHLTSTLATLLRPGLRSVPGMGPLLVIVDSVLLAAVLTCALWLAKRRKETADERYRQAVDDAKAKIWADGKVDAPKGPYVPLDRSHRTGLARRTGQSDTPSPMRGPYAHWL